MKKRILFLTGTRADYGKLQPLIKAVSAAEEFDYSIFATGMHVNARYGFTVEEIQKAGFRNIHTYINHIAGEPMEQVLANTVSGLSRYVHELKPDMIVVHGDRIEALAGAVVGALRNVLVAHIEGGEVSGTVDELIRHAVSKLSHVHFVANEQAASLLRQMGEKPDTVFVIGSPDIDVMLSDKLPTLASVKARYDIQFETYAIALFHPITTESLAAQQTAAEEFVRALIDSGCNYVVVYPNNDRGCEAIFEAYRALDGNKRFRVFPSLRFEYFLSLMKAAKFVVGNSSAGIREAPVYGVPSINIGARQVNRFHYASITNVAPDRAAILQAIAQIDRCLRHEPSRHFGRGDSVSGFMSALRSTAVWRTSVQKQFQTVAGLTATAQDA